MEAEYLRQIDMMKMMMMLMMMMMINQITRNHEGPLTRNVHDMKYKKNKVLLHGVGLIGHAFIAQQETSSKSVFNIQLRGQYTILKTCFQHTTPGTIFT